MSCKILKYQIFNGTKIELISYIEKYEKIHIISGNPEVLSNGMKSETLFKNFTGYNSVIIPDGIGTVIASILVRQPVKEKIAGIEVMSEILQSSNDEHKGIYLIGTKEEILIQCVKNLKLKYPNVDLLGYHDGYFDLENCKDIIDDIISKKPYALFVAMGSPRQEMFIARYMDILPCNIFMGVGGSFDILAGKIKRAPKWMIDLGLEWLYRVAKEPWRIKRLSSIPKFILKVIYNKYVVKDKI